MAGKVIQGRHCKLKVVYGEVPYSFRATDFEEQDGAELRSRSVLGEQTEEQDRIPKNYSGSISVLHDKPTLDVIEADMQAREDANLPPKDIQITVTKVYRDGTTAPGVKTFTGVAMKVDTSFKGRAEDVVGKITWQASRRLLG